MQLIPLIALFQVETQPDNVFGILLQCIFNFCTCFTMNQLLIASYLKQVYISTSCSNVSKGIPLLIKIISSDPLIVVTKGLRHKW